MRLIHESIAVYVPDNFWQNKARQWNQINFSLGNGWIVCFIPNYDNAEFAKDVEDLNEKIAEYPPRKVSDASLVVESPIIPKYGNEYN